MIFFTYTLFYPHFDHFSPHIFQYPLLDQSSNFPFVSTSTKCSNLKKFTKEFDYFEQFYWFFLYMKNYYFARKCQPFTSLTQFSKECIYQVVNVPRSQYVVFKEFVLKMGLIFFYLIVNFNQKFQENFPPNPEPILAFFCVLSTAVKIY